MEGVLIEMEVVWVKELEWVQQVLFEDLRKESLGDTIMNLILDMSLNWWLDTRVALSFKQMAP